MQVVPGDELAPPPVHLHLDPEVAPPDIEPTLEISEVGLYVAVGVTLTVRSNAHVRCPGPNESLSVTLMSAPVNVPVNPVAVE